ncbi:uncharacterized protein GGS22DRAFT_200080 [Annulohypoxylon maeteangense]|uniref:uncharacterized protein n=1 Tax=Annulohypoxylon maeteangense TaxID=1927788 RepID=UPI002007BAB4|nr:uncharacterized protein GGS22DRAFT_200080 [Annulohypoxylon maeteangense]KAI0884982.1 hypothetical protein GGS22DRAFT_200080 [Annulohypoxylon maeteangense]
METGRLHPTVRDNIQWAGNGILTYSDPDFPYTDLQPIRISNTRATYSVGQDERSLENPRGYRTAPIPQSCQVQYPYGPREVLAALVKEMSSSSDSSDSPDSPGSLDSPSSPDSPSSSQGESPRHSSEFEDRDMPLHVRPLVRRRVTTDHDRSPEPERQRHRERVAGSERRHPRHRSVTPPRTRREPRSERGFQGPTARRIQDFARNPQLYPPHPRAREEHGDRRRRRSEAQVRPDITLDSLWGEVEQMCLESEPSSPETARPPVTQRPAAPQRRSARPEHPRRTATHAGSSSGRSHRRRDEHERERDSGRLETQVGQGVIIDAPNARRDRTRREAELASAEIPRDPAPPVITTPSRRTARPQASRRATTPVSSSGTFVTVRHPPRPPQSLAEHLRAIDEMSGMPSKLKKDGDEGSMVVQIHQDSCHRRGRRHHHRDERDGKPAEPKKSRTSRLGFLSHLVRNT